MIKEGDTPSTLKKRQKSEQKHLERIEFVSEREFRRLNVLFLDTPSSGPVSNCSLRHLCPGLTNRKKHTYTPVHMLTHTPSHSHMHTDTCQPADVLLHTHHRSPVYTLPQA